MFKKVLSGAACLALLITMLCLSGCEKAYIGSSKQTLDKLNIQAQIMNNGDMKVIETWTVNLKDRGKAYHRIYKTFGVLPDGKAAVTDYSIYDEDNHIQYKNVKGYFDPTYSDDENVCYLTTSSYEQELGLLMPNINEGVRTFTFRYTVKSQVSSYQDTSVFYYKFISTNFTIPITNMTCSIKLPDGAIKENLRAWLHCTSNSDLVIDSGNKISFTASEIPARTQVETRICMPTKLFSSSTAVSKENRLESIKSEEQQWASDWQAKRQRNYIFTLIDVVGGIALVLFGIILLIHNRRKFKRCKVDVPEYTHDIPPDNSPAGIANLFYYYDGGITSDNKGYVLSATFLELARKGYLKFNGQGKKDLTVLLTGKHTNGNWIDLSLCEHRLLGLIISVANNYNGSFTMRQFEEFAKANYQFTDDAINDFSAKSSQEISQKGYFKYGISSTYFGKSMGTFLIIAAISIFIIKSAYDSSHSSYMNPINYFILIGAFICGILMKICYRKRERPLTEIGERDYLIWHGLKKYMLEFSRLKEYDIPQLELWEEYLVYATMMGISKQVCKQLKLVYPEVCDQNYRDTHWDSSSYMFYMFKDFNSTDGYSGHDLGTILSDHIFSINDEINTLINPPSSSDDYDSGGGGGGSGFDGGGGGFDGGGGGID